MNIEEWIVNLDSKEDWFNGLKWLSKLIVASGDEEERKQHKEVLIQLVEDAILNRKHDIKVVGFYYLFKWHRLDILRDLYNKAKDKRDFNSALMDAIDELFDERPAIPLSSIVRDKDFDYLCRFSKELSEYNIKSKDIIDDITKGFFCDDINTQLQYLDLMNYLFYVVDVNRESFKDKLQDYINRLSDIFAGFKSDDDWEQGFEVLLKVEKLKITESFPEIPIKEFLVKIMQTKGKEEIKIKGFYITLKLKRHILFFEHFDINSILPYIAKALDYIFLEKNLRFIRFDNLLKKALDISSDMLYNLVSLFVEGKINEASVVNLFMEGLKSNDTDEIINSFGMISELKDKINIKSEIFGRAIFNFLDNLWNETIFSDDPFVWKRGFNILEEIISKKAGDYVKDEFFFPLLREGIKSTNKKIRLFTIGFIKENNDYKEYIEYMLKDKVLIDDLIEPLILEQNPDVRAILERINDIASNFKINLAYLKEKMFSIIQSRKFDDNTKNHIINSLKSMDTPARL